MLQFVKKKLMHNKVVIYTEIYIFKIRFIKNLFIC